LFDGLTLLDPSSERGRTVRVTLCGSSKGEEKPGNEVRGGRALVSDENPLTVVSRRRNVVESVTKSGVRDNLKKTGVCGGRRGGENALGDSKGVSDARKLGESHLRDAG
jgi:hypothetical protein